MRTLSCYVTLLFLVGYDKGGKDSDEFRPLENGFGYGVHTKGFTDKTLRADLQYRDSNGTRTVVWPQLQMIAGNNIVIMSNTAVLVGGRAELYDDGVGRLRDRLFAFQAPAGPPMDITDQVFEK